MDDRSSLEPVEYWRMSEASSRAERPLRSVSEPEKSTSWREHVKETRFDTVADGNGVAAGEWWLRVVGDGAASRVPEEIEAILSRTCGVSAIAGRDVRKVGK